MAEFDVTDPHLMAQMHAAMGPHAVDQQIRQAISLCWMMLPEGKRNVAALEAEIRRIVDRALKDLREDAKRSGVLPRTPPASS